MLGIAVRLWLCGLLWSLSFLTRGNYPVSVLVYDDLVVKAISGTVFHIQICVMMGSTEVIIVRFT